MKGDHPRLQRACDHRMIVTLQAYASTMSSLMLGMWPFNAFEAEITRECNKSRERCDTFSYYFKLKRFKTV